MIAERLADLGIVLPAVTTPAGTYVPAVVMNSLVFTAGQIPFINGSLPAVGKVGLGERLVSPEVAKDLARVCAVNALAAVADVLGSLDRVTQVVKVTGFVASAFGFTGQPGVIDGASELLGDVFGERGRHARSAVGVAELPLGAPVEVELIVAFS
ncbi:RidA family protein [Rathayibacter toxicus]|uniref:LysR family transcriptional regulator n=1 Tax=Rathayibacter toxicus TaxID=145458 RepID=A0A0C5BG81_9MICO|nr:RidA family protein [Rathayibacter toxicus]AJM78089.1 LysR family transcriptional regulator [Rathayibacter toxicus]ALS57662.1 LysR family transcriptional regulator [Rathayibacter toxicus]KKM45008.1 LysR family transcriptional regulator [Rathayibacter toxicus]PPG20666.1 RidA family protein [Rathayibacter toxicus]PPG45770.1 RidA family protein [Rathayibacter toxicus]